MAVLQSSVLLTCYLELKSKRSSLGCCYIDSEAKTCTQDRLLRFKALKNATQHLLLPHYFYLFLYEHIAKPPAIEIVLCFPIYSPESMQLKYLIRSTDSLISLHKNKTFALFSL